MDALLSFALDDHPICCMRSFPSPRLVVTAEAGILPLVIAAIALLVSSPDLLSTRNQWHRHFTSCRRSLRSGHWMCVSWMLPKRWQIKSRIGDSVFVPFVFSLVRVLRGHRGHEVDINQDLVWILGRRDAVEENEIPTGLDSSRTPGPLRREFNPIDRWQAFPECLHASLPQPSLVTHKQVLRQFSVP